MYKERLNKDYPKYFEVLDILGRHYFKDGNESNIYLSIDSHDLEDLFENIKGDVSGEQYLRNICMEFLGSINGKRNIFDNLIRLHDEWDKTKSNDFPPQLPFVCLFIIAAAKMGENSEVVDWRNYYTQLYRYMNTPSGIPATKVENNFRDTFGKQTTDNKRHELFNKLSEWIVSNPQYGNNTFTPNHEDERDHRSWILKQCLINKKDRNILPDFFKDRGYEHGNPYYSEKELFKAFKRYLSNEYKARSFSPALRNNVLNENLELDLQKRISETIKDIFTYWDGEILTKDGYKSLELLYVIQKNEEEKGKLELKLLLDDSNKGVFSELDVENIKGIDRDENQLVLKEHLFIESIYFKENLQNIKFNENIWRLEDLEVKARLISYEKDIRLFKFDEFGIREYIEVPKHEPINSSETYLAVFSNEIREELQEWLSNNPNYNYQELHFKEYDEVCVIDNIQLINSEEYTIKEPYMEIFVPSKVRTEKIELIGGLKVDSKTYLSRELPTVFIPETLRKNENLIIKINGKEFHNDKDQIRPDEYIEDSNTKKYELTVNEDDIRIIFNVEFDDSVLTSHLAGTIGYDFSFNGENIVWEDINPDILDYEDLKTGFITGGHLYIPNVYSEIFDKLNFFEFTKPCKKIILIGREANELEEIKITPDKFDWVGQFSNEFKSYRLTEPKSDDTSEEIKLTNYDQYNLNFSYFKKETNLRNLTWAICIYDYKTQIYQYGNKSPKTGFENTKNEWAQWLLYIDEKIENEEKLEYINVVDSEEEPFNDELLNKYIETSKELISEKEKLTIDLGSIREEKSPNKKSETTRYIHNIHEFRELPGERLLRYMSNVGSGTISSLREAITYIAFSEPLNDLKFKKYFEENMIRETNRIIQNLSYLLHIEQFETKNKWCIAKPSINLLPGLNNRAIITGSRNDFLMERLFNNIKASDTYSVSLIDNSKFLDSIKYLETADQSQGSIRISVAGDTVEKFHTYETFSPTTIMISEFESIKDLAPLAIELGIEEVNENTAYSYIALTPSIDEMIDLSPKKQIKRYQKPERFDDFLISQSKAGYGWVKEFYAGFSGATMSEGNLYRTREMGLRSDYFVYKNSNTHLVTRDIAHYSQMHKSKQNLIFYKKQLPGGILIIPSYLKLPKLYHKALGFCTGTNPITRYIRFNNENKVTPKLDFYYNIPDDLVHTLFSEKINCSIKYIEEINEIPELLGEKIDK